MEDPRSAIHLQDMTSARPQSMCSSMTSDRTGRTRGGVHILGEIPSYESANQEPKANRWRKKNALPEKKQVKHSLDKIDYLDESRIRSEQGRM